MFGYGCLLGCRKTVAESEVPDFVVAHGDHLLITFFSHVLGRVDVGVPDVVLDRDDGHGVDREGAEKVCLRSWKRSGRNPARLRAVLC